VLYKQVESKKQEKRSKNFCKGFSRENRPVDDMVLIFLSFGRKTRTDSAVNLVCWGWELLCSVAD